MAWHDAMPRAKDEHRFSCVGLRVGKSKCGTVWNGAKRNAIAGYSCCAMHSMPGRKLVSAAQRNEQAGGRRVEGSSHRCLKTQMERICRYSDFVKMEPEF